MVSQDPGAGVAPVALELGTDKALAAVHSQVLDTATAKLLPSMGQDSAMTIVRVAFEARDANAPAATPKFGHYLIE